MRWAVTVLVFCVASLLALGIVMLYSSSMADAGTRFLSMQCLWGAVGLLGAIIAALCDYRLLKKFAWVLYAVGVVMLIVVLTHKFGSVHGGARRWFNIGRWSFQPSEFGKLALLIALARYAEHNRRQMPTWKKGILIPGLMIGIVVGLIFKEPDVGNALVLSTVCCCVLLLAGIRFWYFIPPALVAAAGVGLFIYHNPMRSERIYSWLHVEETKQSKGMQAYEAMLALGSGGVTGKGLGDSRQKLGFVPEHHTDFIFCIIGEELGLIATLLVVAAFVAILFCGVFISLRAPDLFGLFLGSGITFLICLSALVNIGVVTSALPNKGLPLPFISYGGTNLALTLCSVGVLLSIARKARMKEAITRAASEAEEEADNPFSRGGRPATA